MLLDPFGSVPFVSVHLFELSPVWLASNGVLYLFVHGFLVLLINCPGGRLPRGGHQA